MKNKLTTKVLNKVLKETTMEEYNSDFKTLNKNGFKSIFRSHWGTWEDINSKNKQK